MLERIHVYKLKYITSEPPVAKQYKDLDPMITQLCESRDLILSADTLKNP